jgi:hypothetical protein
LANANFHRGRNTKDTVTVVKERKKEEEEGLVLSSSTSLQKILLVCFGVFLYFYDYEFGVRILYGFIFSDVVHFVDDVSCVYEYF